MSKKSNSSLLSVAQTWNEITHSSSAVKWWTGRFWTHGAFGLRQKKLKNGELLNLYITYVFWWGVESLSTIWVTNPQVKGHAFNFDNIVTCILTHLKWQSNYLMIENSESHFRSSMQKILILENEWIEWKHQRDLLVIVASGKVFSWSSLASIVDQFKILK